MGQEKRGIITGIGALPNDNVITPEIDAVINDFIIGYNTIINGLVMTGNNLSAGTCVLFGYRGTIDTGLNNITDNYVYGEFLIYGDGETVDEFKITTSNDYHATASQIVFGQTNYLLLYSKTGTQYDKEVYAWGYPKEAYRSDFASTLHNAGIISPLATTPTALVDDNTQRVANTQFVQNQIEKDISYRTFTTPVYADNALGSGSTQIGNLTLIRKAKYVIGTFSITTASLYPDNNIRFTLPIGFVPEMAFDMAIEYQALGGQQYLEIYQVSTSRTLTRLNRYSSGQTTVSNLQFGYICQ